MKKVSVVLGHLFQSFLARGKNTFLGLLCLCLMRVPDWRYLQHPFRNIWKAIRKPRKLTSMLFLKFQGP